MPPLFEPVCLAIIALSFALAVARSRSRTQRAWRLVLLAVAAWIGEDTMIHAYGAYEYAPGWSLSLDGVPVLVPLIWPIVVHSAWQLASGLVGESARVGRVAVAGALLVLADAAFIEPIAVASGLWRWTLPGPFSVPFAGVLGWSWFAVAAIAWLEARERGPGGLARDLSVLVLAPLAAHALVLATWWGALRWVLFVPSDRTAAALAWLVSLALSAPAARRRPGPRLLPELSARVPAALVFFALLLRLEDATLRAYALAFAPPYVVLVLRELAARPGRHEP